MRNRRGFTLVEVLVVGALAGAGVLAALRGVAAVRRDQGSSALKLLARSALDRELSRVIGSPGDFPPMQDSARAITFVRCYNVDGTSIANSRGTSGYLAVSLGKTREPSGYCAAGGFEIHVTPSSTGGDKVAEVVILRQAATSDLKQIYLSKVSLTPTL